MINSMRLPQLPGLGAVTIPPGVNPNDPESLLSHAISLSKIKDIDGAGHFSFLSMKVADALARRQADPREREKFRRMSEAAEAFRAKLFEVKEERLVPTEEATFRPPSEKWAPFSSRIPKTLLREGMRRITVGPGTIPEEEEVAADFEKKAVRSLFLLDTAEKQAQTAVTQEEVDVALETASRAMKDVFEAQTTARIFAPWFPKDVTRRRSWVASIGGKTKELIDSLMRKKIELSISEATRAMATFSKASQETIPLIISGKISSPLLRSLLTKADEVMGPALAVSASPMATKSQKKLAEEILAPVRKVQSIIDAARKKGVISFLDPRRFIWDFPRSVDSLEKADEVIRTSMAISRSVAEKNLPPASLDLVELGLRKVADFVSKVAITGTFPERWEAERILLSSLALKKSLGMEYETPIPALIDAAREFAKESLRTIHGTRPEALDPSFFQMAQRGLERIKELALKVEAGGTEEERRKMATIMAWSRHLKERIEKSKS